MWNLYDLLSSDSCLFHQQGPAPFWFTHQIMNCSVHFESKLVRNLKSCFLAGTERIALFFFQCELATSVDVSLIWRGSRAQRCRVQYKRINQTFICNNRTKQYRCDPLSCYYCILVLCIVQHPPLISMITMIPLIHKLTPRYKRILNRTSARTFSLFGG